MGTMRKSFFLNFNRTFFLMLLGSFLFTERSLAKPFVFEGFIETAPTNFPSAVTHLMRFEPGGKIDLALVDPGGRLKSRPLERVKILGELASERVTSGVPLIQVEEVAGASWTSARFDFSGGNVANWGGFGSSFYPSIAREPLPEAGFVTAISNPNPKFYLRNPVYSDESFRFRLVGADGWRGVVEASTNLILWSPILTNTIEAGEIGFIDSSAITFTQRFYRVRAIAPE